MSWQKWFLLILFSLVVSVDAETGKVMKVLPHLLDLKGRHTLQSSLYERDAYQAFLRQNREKCSGLRFDIQYKARQVKNPLLRLEMRAGTQQNPTQKTLEKNIRPSGWRSDWTAFAIEGDDFQKLGQLVAFRVTLWEGNQQLSEYRSFLW